MFLKQKYDEEYCEEISGGRRQARTADILLVRQALSQLSYTPTKGLTILKSSRHIVKKSLTRRLRVAERTGLEPATPCVTGRYSNQLNYRSRCFRLSPIMSLKV